MLEAVVPPIRNSHDSDEGRSYNAESVRPGTGVFRLMKASASLIVAKPCSVGSPSGRVSMTTNGNSASGSCLTRPEVELMCPLPVAAA